MNKKVLEALLREEVSTVDKEYPFRTNQEYQDIKNMIEEKKKAGDLFKHKEVDASDAANPALRKVVIYEPDEELPENELDFLVKLKLIERIRESDKKLNTIKNILIFFCSLTCVSLALGVIYAIIAAS